MRTPAAIATVVSAGVARRCPDCGIEETCFYGLMGTHEPLRCARCYDDWAFAGKPAVRARMEASRDLLFSGVRHLLDRVEWVEAA